MSLLSRNACPLCLGQAFSLFCEDKKRSYNQCHTCDLVYVPAEYHLSAKKEKEEYDKHINAIDDEGYLRFLSRATEPLLEKLSNLNVDMKNLQGLDFGCGPGPALAHILRQKGLSVACYDPIYYPDGDVLKRTYDFITCTEVVEHFNKPAQSWELLMSLLHTDSILVVMTKRVIDKDRFKNWHYKNDPSHVSFYSTKTMTFLAEKFNKRVEFVDKDVCIFLAI